MTTHAKTLARSIKALNSQFWVLSAGCQATVKRSRSLRTFDGHAHSLLLDVVFQDAEERSRVRLHNKTAATDLEELAGATGRWLPAYFTLLSKSLMESTLRALVDERLTTSLTYQNALSTYRKQPKRSKESALQTLVQAAARAEFDEFEKVFPLGAERKRLDQYSSQLKIANKVRNGIAHDLATMLSAGPGTTVKNWTDYTDAVERAIEIIESRL